MRIIFALLSFFLLKGCGGDKDVDFNIPSEISEMDNVNIFHAKYVDESHEVKLVKDKVFGNDHGVYFRQVYELITNEKGRLFVYDGHLDSKKIHVFEPDGSYVKNLAPRGNGPGDLSNPCCLNVRNNQLIFYDHNVSRVSIFSTETLKLIETIRVNPDEMGASGELSGLQFNDYFYLDDGLLLLKYSESQMSNETKPGTYQYFTTGKEWGEINDFIFKQDKLLEVWGEWQGMRIMKLFPFFNKPLITVTPSGRIFVADSENLFIRELDHNGRQIGGFYYATTKIPLSREDAKISANEMERDIARNVNLPEHWPVLKTLSSDDNDRLWISTYTKKEDELHWWIFKPNGKLIGKFRHQGDRYSNPLNNGEKLHIQGNYLYKLENINGSQQVVRYRIEMNEK